jgi:hypothetical protein
MCGLVAYVGGGNSTYRVLVGKSEGKRQLGRPRHSWENNIKVCINEVLIRSGEICRILCICCVYISVQVRLVCKLAKCIKVFYPKNCVTPLFIPFLHQSFSVEVLNLFMHLSFVLNYLSENESVEVIDAVS